MRKGIIAAVCVTFYPDLKLLSASLESYLEAVDRVYIVDNTPGKCDFSSLPACDKAVVTLLGENKGIAFALNEGVRMALRDGADYVLTMDQDTEFTPAVSRFPIDLIGPDTMGIVPQFGKIDLSENRYVEKAVQSGTLFSAEAMKRIGVFNTDYFIDYVDYEYFKRGRALGYRLLQSADLRMHHRNGEIFKGRFLWKKYDYRFSVPVRMYYQTRNAMDYIRRFGDMREVIVFVMMCLRIIVLANKKGERLRYVGHGLADWLRGVWGPYEKRKQRGGRMQDAERG